MLIGIGAGGDLDGAREFVESTGARSFPMLWDPSFASWEHYRIRSNSQVWILTPTGEPVETVVGLDRDGILDRVSGLTARQ